MTTFGETGRVRSGHAPHSVNCDSVECPCFDEGYELGYRHKEREERLGLPSVFGSDLPQPGQPSMNLLIAERDTILGTLRSIWRRHSRGEVT